MSKRSIGERIREKRKECELTQQQLADKLNISLMTIRRFETDVRQPKLEMIDKIALALDVDPWYLAFGDDPPKNYSTTITTEFTDYRNALFNGLLNGNDEKNKIIEGVKEYLNNLRTDTINKYDSLNVKGQEKANSYITGLADTREFTTPDKALQSNEGDV